MFRNWIPKMSHQWEFFRVFSWWIIISMSSVLPCHMSNSYECVQTRWKQCLVLFNNSRVRSSSWCALCVACRTRGGENWVMNLTHCTRSGNSNENNLEIKSSLDDAEIHFWSSAHNKHSHWNQLHSCSRLIVCDIIQMKTASEGQTVIYTSTDLAWASISEFTLDPFLSHLLPFNICIKLY